MVGSSASSVWFSEYLGPIISAAAEGSLLKSNGARIAVRNTHGQTLATAQLQVEWRWSPTLQASGATGIRHAS